MNESKALAQALQKSVAALKQATREGLEQQYPNGARLWERVRASMDRDAGLVLDSTVPGSRATRCF